MFGLGTLRQERWSTELLNENIRLRCSPRFKEAIQLVVERQMSYFISGPHEREGERAL